MRTQQQLRRSGTAAGRYARYSALQRTRYRHQHRGGGSTAAARACSTQQRSAQRQQGSVCWQRQPARQQPRRTPPAKRYGAYSSSGGVGMSPRHMKASVCGRAGGSRRRCANVIEEEYDNAAIVFSGEHTAPYEQNVGVIRHTVHRSSSVPLSSMSRHAPTRLKVVRNADMLYRQDHAYI